MTTQFQQAVQSVTSLKQLRDALRAHKPETLEDERLMTMLPTFGGIEPRHTVRVWSWDATHLLVGAGADEIVPRNERDGL